MKSIGISVFTKRTASLSNVKDSMIQLHLNLWKYRPHRKNHWAFWRRKSRLIPFNLDIGIMGKFSISGIRIYLPFELKNTKPWTDLSPILTQYESILASLFNDDYKVQEKCGNLVKVSLATPKLDSEIKQEFHPAETWWCVGLRKIKECLCGSKNQYQDVLIPSEDATPPQFYICHLQDSDVKVTNYAEKGSRGYMLAISIPEQHDLSQDEYFYIRLRISIHNSKDIAYNTDLSNDWLQSAFTRLDMYNLQINEIRNIPDMPILDLQDGAYKTAVFSKIHMLYVSSPEVEIKTGSAVKSDSRLIEAENWHKYIPSQYIADVYLAHHWKFSPKKSATLYKMQLFFTAEYPQLNFNLRVVPYLAGVILLGCLGSILASFACGGNPPVLRNVLIITIFSVLFYFLWYILSHIIIPFI